MIKFLFGIVLFVSGFYRTIFVDPVWGLYLFAALTHIRIGQLAEEISLPMNIPMAIALLSLVLYAVSSNYEKKFNRWPLEVWLLGLMVVGMAISSHFAHYNPALSWDKTFDYFKYWVFFVLIIQMVDSLEKIEWFHRTLILSVAWLVYRCYDLRGTTGFRFENFGGDVVADANHFSAALVLLFPFVFKKTLSSDKRIVFCAIILCFGIVMSVVIAVSRGAFLGCIALIILIILNFKQLRRKVLVVTVIVFATVLFFANADQKERLFGVSEATKEETRDESAQGRVNFWKLSWELFQKHSLTGVGIGNFGYYSGPTLEGLKEGEPGHVAHSIWFETLAEGGLLVSIPFFSLLIRFFMKTGKLLRQIRQFAVGKEHENYIRVLRIAMGAFLISATFINRLIYEPIYWCIALGIVHEYLLKDLFRNHQVNERVS